MTRWLVFGGMWAEALRRMESCLWRFPSTVLLLWQWLDTKTPEGMGYRSVIWGQLCLFFLHTKGLTFSPLLHFSTCYYFHTFQDIYIKKPIYRKTVFFCCHIQELNTFKKPPVDSVVGGKFMSIPSGSSIDVKNRTWPVCPWAEPMGTRGDFRFIDPVPELTAGITRVRTTPEDKHHVLTLNCFIFLKWKMSWIN